MRGRVWLAQVSVEQCEPGYYSQGIECLVSTVERGEGGWAVGSRREQKKTKNRKEDESEQKEAERERRRIAT